MKRYRVTQYSTFARPVSKTYRFKFVARFVAWLFSGTSLSGLDFYTTEITETD